MTASTYSDMGSKTSSFNKALLRYRIVRRMVHNSLQGCVESHLSIKRILPR